jgi:hypothetical protein
MPSSVLESIEISSTTQRELPLPPRLEKKTTMSRRKSLIEQQQTYIVDVTPEWSEIKEKALV